MTFSSGLVKGPWIGGGMFGDVFTGTDQINGKVAIKATKKLPTESPVEWAARSAEIIAEGVRLKSANHQNIVHVINVLTEDTTGVAHLVLEFCDEGSLQPVYESGPTSIRRCRKVATEVTQGLANVHHCGMIHRDIKPGNILVHKSVAKLGDFGLVTDQIILGYAAATGYTAHLAPEVFIDQVTSVKTDIWALGMTLYRMLHGKRFYEENFPNAGTVARSVLNGGFASRLKWLPHVPSEWRRLIRKAMNDDSGLRFSDAILFSQALSALPIQPNWQCEYNQDDVTWTRTKNNRHITVILDCSSPRKCSWIAMATGGSKRDLRLGGDKGPLTKIKAFSQLERFFREHQ